MSDMASKRRCRIEKVAPDGGFGYLIALGMALPFGCCFGIFLSFGLIYNDFLKSLGAGTSAVTIITSSFWSAVSFAGLFGSSLFNTFSVRSVGLFGATCYFLGSFLTIFANSVEFLIVSFGVLQGMGIMFTVSFTTFNHYFIKKRVLVLSITQTIQGSLTTIFPMLAQYLMDQYGFKGTVAIIAAINAHAIFGMLVMHPVEWHYKTVEIPDGEVEPLPVSRKKEIELKTYTILQDKQQLRLLEENKKNHLSVPNLNQDYEKANDSEEFAQRDRSKSIDETQSSLLDPIQTRIASIMSLGNVGGDAVVSEARERLENGKWQKVVHFLDLTLLKDLIYVNIAIGLTMSLYSDGAFFILLPMYLFDLGFSKDDAAIISSASSAAELCCRAIMAVVSLRFQFKARSIFFFGSIAITLIRCVLLLKTFSFMGVLSLIVATGFFRGFMHLTVALCFAEYLPAERFPPGYGLFLFLQGNLSFLMSPFTGWIRDITQSYTICFHSLTVIMCVCLIPWTIELIWFRKTPRKQ